MSEDKHDVVSRDDYNKIVEAHNSIKIEKERIERELIETKQKEETNKAIEQEKMRWEKEKVELLKQQQEELKKLAESKTTIAKGIVSQPASSSDDFEKKLDKVLPKPNVDTSRIHSAYGKLKHFKSPATKSFSREELGRGLSIHATAQKVDPTLIPQEARIGTDDIRLRK